MTNIVVSRSAIAATVADYLGYDEDDVGSKQALVKHQLATAGVAAPDTLPPRYLHWTQRSNAHLEKITEAFEKVLNEDADWWYNGDTHYNMCGIEESRALKAVILEAPKDRKEFYVLDMGAGDFQWSKTLAEYINKQTDLPSDITVHIINLRGEPYEGEKTVTSGKCKIHS